MRNTIPIPATFYPGISFCLAKMLRLGIILVGIRLSIFAVLKIGLLAVGIVVACISVGLIFTIFAALKLKLPERLGTLIAVGTGICGATAIVAIGPSIDAKEEEVAYAVGTITLFGIVVMFLYPYISHLLLGLTHIQAGIFMGTAIHETAQVAGAGLMYDQLWITTGVHPTGMDVAIVTKLVRNTFMALVIPLAAYFYTRRQLAEKKDISIVKLFPLFILGFLGMAVVRSLGDLFIVKQALFWSANSWSSFCHFVNHWAGHFLALAMAGVGLGTEFKKLKELGIRPFLVGLVAALTVGVVSLTLVKVLAPFLHVVS
jgi:uncharacterized integral membrane protein (TIGR00698 family)